MTNLTPEHKYYIGICGLFNDYDRDILELWAKYKPVFEQASAKDKQGQAHIWQAIILFFMKKYPSEKGKANDFCKMLYEQEFFDA